MTDQVRIVEVGPRDGLQNEKTPVGVEERVAFIEALLSAGLHTVEIGAFVSPKAIPQMVGSDEVLRRFASRSDGEFHVLVPNEKGYEAARAAGAQVIAVFASASEGFSRANINCSVAESIERFKPVVSRAKSAWRERPSKTQHTGLTTRFLTANWRSNESRPPWKRRALCPIPSP